MDLEAIRREFPVMQNMLYLDSAHQTPMPTCVRTALAAFLAEANEMAGPKPVWMARVEATRAKVAALLNATPAEVAFTKNTSESLNIAAHAVPLQEGDTVLMLEGDHPNNAYAWLNLRRKGVRVRFIPLADDAVATAATFAAHLDASVRVISLSHVSFHAGQCHDIERIGRLCAGRGILLVVDAMQSVGVLPVDVRQLGIGVLAAGCHKGLLIPQGMGLLYVRADLQALQPVYVAMSSLAHPPDDYIARPGDMALRDDAGRFEFGNYNLPDAWALGVALDFIGRAGVRDILRHVRRLGDRLIEGLDALGVGLVGPREPSQRAHIYVLALPVAEWVAYFAQKQVRVSPERGGVRLSFGLFNTVDDVDRVLALIGARLGRAPAAGARNAAAG